MWLQHTIRLTPKARGFHLVTDEVLDQLPDMTNFEVGLCHLFILHTSASLTVNENADPDVRIDMETYFNLVVPEQGLPLRHTLEGPDDMPAHVKSSMLGASLMLPIRGGKFAFGTWQGIYLCEHRNRASARNLIATLQGSTKSNF